MEKGMGAIMPEDLFKQHSKAVARAMGKEKVGAKVAVVNCVITPHDEGEKPVPVRVTVRMVESKTGTRYAIAHVDATNEVKEMSVK
jgi:hypothetical protein